MQQVTADVALQVRDRWLARAQAATDIRLKAQALISAHEDLNYVDARKRYLLDGEAFTTLYLDNLIRAQDRLQTAETSLLQAQINHAAAHADLHRATGTMRRSVIGSPNVPFDRPLMVRSR